MPKHVAVLMGGWSAEREVSLTLRARPAPRRWRARATASPASTSAATSPQVLAALKPDVVLQRAARPLRRGRHHPGHAGDPGHPLHPLRRAGLGARHAQGPGQGRDGGGRRAGAAAAMVVTASRRPRRHVLPPPYVVKPVDEGSSSASSSSARSAAIRRRSWAATTGPSATWCWSEHYVAGRELTCAVMGDEALGVIDIVADGWGLLRLRREVREGRLHPRPARQKLNRIFTNRFKSWR